MVTNKYPQISYNPTQMSQRIKTQELEVKKRREIKQKNIK